MERSFLPYALQPAKPSVKFLPLLFLQEAAFSPPPERSQSVQYIFLSKSFSLYIVITALLLPPFYTTRAWGQGLCLAQDLSVLAQLVAYTKYSEITC